ncbi:MAG: hypothetical protein MJ246_00475 [Clostridia bacterium]|nr:hypothetical protein [Clostridia bacterium]
MNKIKGFFKNEEGINTIEIVIILAVVVGIALIFRDKMIEFAGNILGDVLNTQTDISPETIRTAGLA